MDEDAADKGPERSMRNVPHMWLDASILLATWAAGYYGSSGGCVRINLGLSSFAGMRSVVIDARGSPNYHRFCMVVIYPLNILCKQCWCKVRHNGWGRGHAHVGAR